MRGYLITTSLLFGILAVAHALRTVEEWSHFSEDPWFIIIPAIGVLAAGLSLWGWRLLREQGKSTQAS
jgi:cytochrome bd-type quinol oxidase subunit 2